MVMRSLRLSKADAVEQYRRMLFNIMARDLDDHTKNIAFLMTPDGEWHLSPAYDVIYAHNPAGKWTNQHQMSVNGKRDDIRQEDILAVAESISLNKADQIIQQVADAINRWPEFAAEAGIKSEVTKEIGKYHRIMLR